MGQAEQICNDGAAQRQAQVISPSGCDRTGYRSLFEYGMAINFKCCLDHCRSVWKNRPGFDNRRDLIDFEKLSRKLVIRIEIERFVM